MTQKNKPILGKRSFSDLTVTMSIAQLKEHLNVRSTEARTRLQKMRKISDSLESTVKESRGCSIEQIFAIKEEIKNEFAEFIKAGEDLEAKDEEDEANQIEQEMVAQEHQYLREDDKNAIDDE